MISQRGIALFAGLSAVLLVTGADARPPVLPILRPGSPELDVSHIRERMDSTESLRPVPGDTSKKVRVVRYNIEHLFTHARGPAVLLVQQSPSYSDSAVVLRSTLAPISETQNYFTRNRRLVYDYDGNRVRVRDSTAGSPVQVREHSYDGAVFHFNELSLVIRSVPLREGYEALLPLYSEGTDSLEMDTVRVTARDSSGNWTVQFRDAVLVVTHTIDGASRRIIKTAGVRRDAK